jgi:hypothetical protein
MPTRPFYFHEQKLHFLLATHLELVVQEPLVKVLVVLVKVLMVQVKVLVVQVKVLKAVGLNLGQGSLMGFLKEVGTSLVEVTRLGGQLGRVSWQVAEWMYLVGVQHC